MYINVLFLENSIFILIYFCIECSFLNVCLCTELMTGAPGGQKALDPWNWTYDGCESLYVSAGNQMPVLCKISKYS